MHQQDTCLPNRILLFSSGIAVQGLKIHFRIERPWVIDPDFKPVEQVMDTATGYSFPSGHTQSSTSLYSSIAFHFKKAAVYIGAFILIAAVMFSRMYLGCHTPKDVLVSFAVTIAISLAVSLIYDNFNSSLLTDLLVAILIFLLSAGLFRLLILPCKCRIHNRCACYGWL